MTESQRRAPAPPRGTWGTVLLPIRDDDSIDFGAIEAQVDALLRFGVDGVYTNGTAGEFFAQDEDEFDRISGIVAGACRAAGVPFQIGVSHPCPRTQRQRLERARRHEPAAFQCILPDWVRPSDPDLHRFFEGLDDARGDAGLVLYNPPGARRVLTPEELCALADRTPGLVGVKVAGVDAAWFDVVRTRQPALSVFVPGHLLAELLPLGASGAYSNVACLHPGFAVAWWQQMQRDPTGALELGRRICGFLDRHIVPLLRAGYSNPAVDKALACLGSWAEVGTRLRWPHVGIPPETMEALRRAFEAELAAAFPRPR